LSRQDFGSGDFSITDPRRARRIGILGHVGTENLGDEAIITALLQQIRDRYPDARIIAFTGHPEDTRDRHGIAAYPIWRGRGGGSASPAASPTRLSRLAGGIRAAVKVVPGLLTVLKAIRKSARLPWDVLAELRFLVQCQSRLQGIDLLVFAGSNQLNDYWGGAWGFPYTLLKWCVLAKSVGARVAFLCCGAGPLDSRLGKLFIRCSLRLADHRSYRDEGSRRLIAGLGVAGDNVVCTDLAWGLRLAQGAKPEPATSRLTVGINPLPFFDARYWPEHDLDRYQAYIRKLAGFAAWLRERGHNVSFFPTQLRADPPVIQDIRALLPSERATEPEHPLGARPMRSVHDLMLRISTMDVVVATRYHGVLLGAALHKPVVAIAYYEKTRDLMAQIGQSDYVVDIESFDATLLAQRFATMAANIEAIRGQIQQRTQLLRQALAKECDRAFRLLEEDASLAPADERAPALARLNG